MLLAIWADVGAHMRQHLDGYTLADVASQARGELPWPEPLDHAASDEPAPSR